MCSIMRLDVASRDKLLASVKKWNDNVSVKSY